MYNLKKLKCLKKLHLFELYFLCIFYFQIEKCILVISCKVLNEKRVSLKLDIVHEQLEFAGYDSHWWKEVIGEEQRLTNNLLHK